MILSLLGDWFQDNLLQQLLKPFHRHFDFRPDFVVSGSLALLYDFQLVGDRLHPMRHSMPRGIRGVEFQRNAARRLDLSAATAGWAASWTWCFDHPRSLFSVAARRSMVCPTASRPMRVTAP